MEFVSRAAELAEAWHLLEAANGCGLVIVGERGAGKSALLGELASTADSATVRVGASVHESAWRLSGMSAVLSAVDSAIGTQFGRVLYRNRELGSPFDLAQVLHQELSEALTTDLLVLVDDADVMDDLSRTLLGFLARRLGGSPIRIVLAACALELGSPFEGLPVVHLGSLPVETLAAFGRTSAPATTSASVIDVVARVSAGSPMGFLSILGTLTPAELECEAPLRVPLHPGARLLAIAAERIRGASVEAVDVLRLLSASHSLPVTVLTQLRPAAPAALAELSHLGWIRHVADAVEVLDSPLSMAVYWAMPPVERLRVHEELADALTGVDDGLHAWHRSHLGRCPRLCNELLEAATARIADGEILFGIQMAEHALSLPSGEENPLRLEPLVGALLRAGEVNHARRYLKTLLGRSAGIATSPAVGALRVAVDALGMQTIPDDVVQLVMDEHAETDPTGCAVMLLAAATCRLWFWETGSAAVDVARAEELTGDGMPEVAALDLVVRLHAAAFVGQPLPDMHELLEWTESIPRLPFAAPSRLLVARALLISERYDDARRMLDIVHEHSEGTAPLWIQLSLETRYRLELRAGRIDRVRETVELLESQSPMATVLPISRMLQSAEVAFFADDRAVARERLETVRRLVTERTNAIVRGEVMLQEARRDLLEGDFAAAARAFAQVRATVGTDMNPQLLRYHDDEVDALMRLGRTEQARTVLEELHRLCTLAPSRWAKKAQQRAAALVLEVTVSLDAFRRLDASWAEGQDEFLHAQTLADYADRLTRSGHERRAAQVHAQERALLRSMGCSLTALRPAPEATAPPVPSVLDRLSEKERPVVDLVAKGYKNQAIARELFLSVRTVELRLTTVYRKVGVSSRFELIGLMDGTFAADVPRDALPPAGGTPGFTD